MCDRKKIMIDCFIFYNELDLLSYRLNILNDVIDYFIIVESTHTFIGKEKKLFFDENKDLYNEFKNKIIHVIVEDMPYKYPDINISNEEQWKNEIFQRNCISRGLNLITDLRDDDIIIISDLDEIPDPRTLIKIQSNDIELKEISSLEMDFYYYNLKTFLTKWHSSKILPYKLYNNMTCNEIYRLNKCQIIKNGGWHLSYFGDNKFIQNKIINFSHQEFNISEIINLDNIQKNIETNSDLFNRDIDIQKIEISDNKYLPLKYDIFLKKYF